MSDAEVLDTLTTLADRARRVLAPLQAQAVVSAQVKGDASPVTSADRALNAAVLDAVRARHPTHGVLAEEGSHEPGRDRRWICDPVDGTLGLLLGTGSSVFSLAHVAGDRVVAAVVDVPARRERFVVTPDGELVHTVDGEVVAPHRRAGWATPGAGLAGARVDVELWPPSPRLGAADLHRRLRGAGAWAVSLCAGTFAATCVARGVLGGVVLDAPDWWDVVGAAAVVRAAGGTVSDLDGHPLDLAGPCRGALLAAPGLHPALRDAVAGARGG